METLFDYFTYNGRLLINNIFSPKHQISHPNVCTSLANLVEIENRVCEEYCAKYPYIQYQIENHSVKIRIPLETRTAVAELGVYVLRFFPQRVSSPQNSDKHILCIHGLNSGPLYSINSVSHLVESDYDVCCLCLPYFGGSRGSTYLLDLDCRQLMAVWDEYLRQTVLLLFGDNVAPDILGHSYGAHIAIHFTHKYPHMVNRLVLNNAFGLFPLLGKYGYHLGVAMKMEYPTYFLKSLGRWWNELMFYFLDANSPLLWKQVWDYVVGACHELRGCELFNKHIDVGFQSAQASVSDYTIHLLLEMPHTHIAFIWSDDDYITPTHNGLMAHYLCGIFGGKEYTKFYLLRGGGHNPAYLRNGDTLGEIIRHYFTPPEKTLTYADTDPSANIYTKQYKEHPTDGTQPHTAQFIANTEKLLGECYGYPSVAATAASVNRMYDTLLENVAAIIPQAETDVDVYFVDETGVINHKSVNVLDMIYEH